VSAEVDSVVAPGFEGELGILPGHAPFLVGLKAGVVRYSKGGQVTRIAIGGGLAEVTQERVTVLAPTAESSEQIDAAEAESRRAAAAAALDEAGYLSPEDELTRLREALDRAQARVDALRD
jgi:F-type H+-transporting ATPase subunit epsilon